MSIYSPITKHLMSMKSMGENFVPISFRELEKIINRKLPASARKFRAWWSNDANSHTQALAWLKAGYITERVDMEKETLIFRREDKLNGFLHTKNNQEKIEQMPSKNPIFGCMKGTVTIPENVDLTEPADPNWARIVDEEIKERHPV